MSDELLPKNKLNIKDDLQSYWENKENIENNTKEEIKKNKLKNDDIEIESYINKNTNENKQTKFNLNYDDESQENRNTITKVILAIIIIAIIGIIYKYNQEQKEMQIKAEIDKETVKKIRQKNVEEYNERMARKKQEYSQNINYENYKYFKIKYDADNNYDYNFVYNMGVITNNLRNATSRSDDNNYDIEIVGSISKYGGLFYRIDKRKTSNEYDDQISSILSELRKIKYKEQRDTVNFKIYVNNNSYDLN